jgi:hypothetical protein
MHVISRTYLVPKAGTTEAEYEDAASPVDTYDSRKWMYRCAIADGATESSFAREWARRLVRHFGLGSLSDRTMAERIPRLQKRWQKQVDRKPLQWFAQEAATRGAFAAFLGLEMRQRERGARSGQWRAVALGDACLFLVRDDRLFRALPLECASGFSNRPFLLSTRTEQWERESAAIHKSRGTWHVDDEFYLATDALAQWFLTEHEAGSKPWSVLRDLDTDAQAQPFREFIETLRQEKRIRNDDTTLLRVNVAG